VRVPAELGEFPAWLVPGGDPTTWVIAVHGRGAHRGEALRVLPALAATGVTTLVITYRNDQGAPAGRDGCYHLGADEWRDLESAAAYARSRGAERIVLYGWSMGGAIVLNALRRSSGLDGVVGAVLDCPVVDWVATLRMQAIQRRVPAPLTWSALRLVEQRIGVRLVSLDFRQFPMPVPTVVFLDADDRYVAPEPTRAFAKMNGGMVRLVETSGGGHVRSWNVDRDQYEAELTAFLRGLPGG
jgi:pimeloyl-ACP methyl ester carboxylesterase